MTCQEIGSSKKEVIDATCLAGNILNINALMVRNGWATARHQSNTQLKRLEALARQEKIGIWRVRYDNTEHLDRYKIEDAVQLR